MNIGNSKWVATGWHHLYFERPEEWSIGAVTGDYATGYLRLDDSEIPRIELRWERTRGRESVDQVVERYLKNLTGKGKKETGVVKVRRDLGLIKNQSILNERTVEGFHWRTDGKNAMQAYGCLWMCQECGRTVFAQVLGRGGESIMTVASKILNSLDDHARDDRATWSVYGINLVLPATYLMKEHSFLTGRIELTFEDGSTRLELTRMSLAEMHLGGKTFKDWFQGTYSHEINEWSETAFSYFKHSGISGTGLGIDPKTVNKKMAWLPWRQPKKKPLSSCGWPCIDGNRIYVLRHMDEKHCLDVLQQIAGTVVCH